MATFKLVNIRRGYPLALAGEFTACTFNSKQDALAALGSNWEFASGYAGRFNPRHPAATDYYLVARSIDSTLAVVTDESQS